jgi:hypothetical protein
LGLWQREGFVNIVIATRGVARLSVGVSIVFCVLATRVDAGVLIDGSIDATQIAPPTPGPEGNGIGAQVTFADGTFNAADWFSSPLQMLNAANITTSQGQQLSGGDPGAYFGFSGSLSSFSGTSYARFAHFTPGAVYRPQVTGAITSLGGGFTHGSFVNNNNVIFETGLILRQNGKVYWPDVNWAYGLQGTSGWYGNGQLYTTPPHGDPQNWVVVDGPSTDHPNFSATGNPIEFGFWTGYYFWDGTASVTDGVDNWVVNVGYVPEPAALSLIALAPLTGARRWSRRARPRAAHLSCRAPA